MSKEEILYEKDGAIATITLDRPDARNAWSEAMLPQMHTALATAMADRDVRAVILTGAGKSFCAGGDLKSMRDRTGMFEGDTIELRRKYERGLQDITRAFERFEKPIIAAINGAAIGAGLDLALMCDIRIGSERAKFGSTFASVGLIPGDGGAFLLTRAVGFSRAVELILTARVFDAEEALSIGLLHASVAPEQVLPLARERAEQIASLPAPAVQMAKVALYRTYTHDAESALQLTAALQSLVQHTKEHSDAVEAMLAKITGK
ncbi:MAG: enoyl-CoA hydratase-related protein [Myxococcota bacterium]|jgi:enoyl-CoA hydratase/carnithine racemase|nr:enoyl-CoA hydratase-related protein [Myxococcota bacterium]